VRRGLGNIFLIVLIAFLFTSTGHAEENKKFAQKPEAANSDWASKSSHEAPSKKLPYSVQVAAFRVKTHAYEFMAKLRAKGYEAYVSQKAANDRGTWYAVRIGDYKDLQAAYRASSLFKMQENRSAFVIRKGSLSIVPLKEQATEIPISDQEERARKGEGSIIDSQGMEEESAGSLFEQAVSGGTAAGSEQLKGRLGLSNLDINGYIRAGLWLGSKARQGDAEAKASYGEASLKLRARKGDSGDGYAEIRFRDGTQSVEEENNADVREAYVNVYTGPFDIRFGRQIIVWGRADSINPTNNLTPYDYRVRSPDEDDRRQANFGVRSYYNFIPFRLETVWMPTYAESHFPDFTLPPLVQMANSDYPGTKLSGGVEAVRLHYEAPSLDASVSYLYGYSTYPGIEFREANLLSDSPITVGFTTYRHSVVGFDFATNIKEGYGLRGEMAYRRPAHYEDREEVPMPDLYYVMGADSEFLRGNVSIIVQYIGRYVFDWKDIVDPGLSSSGIPPGIPPEQLQQFILDEVELENRMLQGQQDRMSHAGFIRANWKLLQETLSLELVSVYNFTTREIYMRPKVSYDIADSLKLIVGGEIFDGPEKTLFGTVRESQSAGYAEIKVSF